MPTDRRRRPWRRVVALAWLALLAASNGYRLITAPDGVPSPAQTVQQVAARDGIDAVGGTVRIAYRDVGPRDAPVVVLLHGSPVASITFDRLAPLLSTDYRVVIPDLPGFGGSSLRIPDYSIAAHAAYLDDLLGALGIERAHVVGYSMGGGVALELYRQAPDSISSLTLLSAIGVQELELLGNYHLNHAVHVAQLVMLRALTWLVPHFGALETFPLNVAYARNFADTDQRPLRGVLGSITAPVLVLHGRDDGLVPMAAAREHHRLVPHSQLLAVDGGHMVLVSDPAMIAGAISVFTGLTERGAAGTRATAEPQRVAAAARPFDPAHAPPPVGIALLVLLLLLFLATWVSEDLTCISAGLLVANGTVAFLPATLACLAGIFTSDLLLFLAGRHFGRPAVTRRPLRWFVSAESLCRSEQWFERRGAWAILLSRAVPALRVPTYVTAGLLGMRLSRFVWVFLFAATLWTPLLVGLSALIGEPVLAWLATWSRYGVASLFLIALMLLGLSRLVVPLFTWRGRRLAYSRWQRLIRWEFWPPWVFYPPILLYILYLGIRFRGLTLFTATNPGIPASGVVGESKHDIYTRLAAAGDHLVHTDLVPRGDVVEQGRYVAAFRERYRLDWPLVLKPDAGERGRDVAIVRSDAEVADYLARHRGATLVQQYAPGHEFGVFYYRYPGEKHGQLLAITDKRPPAVTGDGRSTLEKLILRDSRAVLMAKHFLSAHAERLHQVLSKGEQVALVELGTHCLGCLFVDGAAIETPQLLTSIDRISGAFDGFYFGRYDIRTPSIDDFKTGRNFKIVELNGVTSEATSIYDPSNSLLSAYRTLMRQWRIAFEIGALNRARGTAPITLSELWRMVRVPRAET
jgi:pimeloyl-ACP methyl ester carboxylesterase/membrane protein DedA with SNARE-associated domain